MTQPYKSPGWGTAGQRGDTVHVLIWAEVANDGDVDLTFQQGGVGAYGPDVPKGVSADHLLVIAEACESLARRDRP